jgi:general secretion pathway protein A
MYAEFYSLTGMPFQLTPDPRFFFGSTEHNKAMAHLTYGIHQGEGFIVITGDVGAGKTTLVDYLLMTLPSSEHVAAKIVTTQLGADDMLRMVAAAFNLFREGADKATLLKRIEEFAATTQSQGRRILLVVDEAQNLPVEALEELRMLSNLMVRGIVTIQAILLGQPQFRNVLGRPELDQLRQRITASCHLGPLSAQETRNYVEHRLNLVGWKRDPNFTDTCFEEIFRHTGGIPRRINTLSSRVMLLGFLEEQHVITDTMVTQVAEELANELGTVVAKVAVAHEPAGKNGAMREPEQPSTEIAELSKRVAGVEQGLYRHDRAIRRALEIVAKYLDRAGS